MSEKIDNVYIKMQIARCRLQKLNLKKSGENKFARYKYYELADFLPSCNEIMKDLKLFCYMSYLDEMNVNLTIVNAENPEETIMLHTPVADATVKGGIPIQHLGSQQTYMRRYLYMLAFEIIEHDAVDASEPAKVNVKTVISEAQRKLLFVLIGKVNAESLDAEQQKKFAWIRDNIKEIESKKMNSVVEFLKGLEQK